MTKTDQILQIKVYGKQRKCKLICPKQRRKRETEGGREGAHDTMASMPASPGDFMSPPKTFQTCLETASGEQ